MGAREVHVYQEIAPALSLRTPRCHFASLVPDGSFVLLLEDLAAAGAKISDGSWAVPGRLARAAVADLAELHVRYESPERLAAVAPWAAARRGKTPEFVLHTLRHVRVHCRDRLSDAYLEVVAHYLEARRALDDLDAVSALRAVVA